MNKRFNPWPFRAVLLLVFSAVVLSGCFGNNTRPSNYYLLTADKQMQVMALSRNKSPALVIRAINIPDYLDRKQIVTRHAAHGLMFSDEHRWGGRFRKNIGRVLSSTLSYYLAGASVAVSPHSQPVSPDFLLEIHFEVFERLANGHVVLIAEWYLVDPETLGTISSGKETVQSDLVIAEKDYLAIVASMSRALDRLGHKIAYAVSQQPF